MSANDLALYDRHAGEWWDEDSPAFRSLHSVNPVRVARLVALLGTRGVDVRGLRVVDLGSGGGIVASLLGEAGARVVCIDRSLASLRAAACGCHVRPYGFAQGDVLAPPLASACADLVVLADVLEHVPDPTATLRAAARVVRPGGHVFTGTLNRTLRARVLAVEVAERIGLVPRGTHDHRMFLTPHELEGMARAAGLQLVTHLGEGVDVVATLRRRRIVARPSRSLAVAYQSLFHRP